MYNTIVLLIKIVKYICLIRNLFDIINILDVEANQIEIHIERISKVHTIGRRLCQNWRIIMIY